MLLRAGIMQLRDPTWCSSHVAMRSLPSPERCGGEVAHLVVGAQAIGLGATRLQSGRQLPARAEQRRLRL